MSTGFLLCLPNPKSMACKVHGNVFRVITLKLNCFWNMLELLQLNCFSGARSLQPGIYFQPPMLKLAKSDQQQKSEAVAQKISLK